jgi:hypothetical protein
MSLKQPADNTHCDVPVPPTHCDVPVPPTHCDVPVPPPYSPSSRVKWHAALESARPRASSAAPHASLKLAEQQQTSTPRLMTVSARASTASSKMWYDAIEGTLKAHGHAACSPTPQSATSITTPHLSPPAARPPCSEIKRAHLADIQSARLSLAALLRDRGEYDRALPIYEECWEERKEYAVSLLIQ